MTEEEHARERYLYQHEIKRLNDRIEQLEGRIGALLVVAACLALALVAAL